MEDLAALKYTLIENKKNLCYHFAMNPNRPSLLRRGLMLVLSSPSGAGKTSITRKLLEYNADLKLSVSVTTRPQRPGELEGIDYYFLSKANFQEQRDRGEFLESAIVFDHFYGTPQGPVEQALQQGKDVLFDIDWQGTQLLSQSARGDLVTVFILPPSWKELERRLRSRAQDSDHIVNKRMSKAHDEMSHWAEYDYVLINDDFKETVDCVQAILIAERLKRNRQLSLSDFIKNLV